MCVFLTPPRQRLEAALDLGDHALADRRRWRSAARARSSSSVGMTLPSSSRMPSTSVSRMSFSARSASATLPATRSALMLNVSPLSLDADRRDHRDEVAAVERLDDHRVDRRAPRRRGRCRRSSPCRRAGAVIRSLRARMSSPSLPERPTARPPWRLIRLTISLLILPTSTISTTSIVAGSVTRMPRTKLRLDAELLEHARRSAGRRRARRPG